MAEQSQDDFGSKLEYIKKRGVQQKEWFSKYSPVLGRYLFDKKYVRKKLRGSFAYTNHIYGKVKEFKNVRLEGILCFIFISFENDSFAISPVSGYTIHSKPIFGAGAKIKDISTLTEDQIRNEIDKTIKRLVMEAKLKGGRK